MLKIYLNARRTPKPSGLEKPANPVNIEHDVHKSETDEYGFTSVADKRDIPNLVTNFSSSNLDGVAYDPERQMMWIRFKGGAVYAYYNVPINTYRQFWNASSKGKYFWANIRKNYSIPYHKLSASLKFIPINNMGLRTPGIRKAKGPLSLQASRDNITLYTQCNTAIQELLGVLHEMHCKGFQDLTQVYIEYKDNQVIISNYLETFFITYDEWLDKYTIEAGPDYNPTFNYTTGSYNFALNAGNQILAYVETLY